MAITKKYIEKNELKNLITLQKNYIDQKDNTKEDKFTLGTGLAWDNTGGSKVLKVTIDHTIYKLVDTIPASPATGDENRIHVVPKSGHDSVDKNSKAEYIWTGTAWEKLGDFELSVDLSPYLKIANVTGSVSATGFTISKDGGTTNLVELSMNSGAFTGTVSGKKVTFDLKDILTAAQNSGFYKVAVDKKGRVTGVANVTLADLTALGVATQAALDALTARVSDIETFVANPLTDAEVTTMFNEVYGS